MRPSDLWPKTVRIIEVGATCGAIGQRLVTNGYRNYLAVTMSRWRCEQIASQFPDLRPRVTRALPLNAVRQNNAEVLVLNGWTSLAVARIRSIRHAQYVALKWQPTPLCWLATLLAILQCLFHRFAWPRVVNCGREGAGPWLIAFRVRRPRPYKGVRRFIPASLGIVGFLQKLEGAGVRHAVLRWFEDLPQLPTGEDIDLIVEDSSLEMVRAALDDGPGIQPIDVYSVTGLPGADFRSMPYFPPYLTEQLLESVVVHRGLCSVPGPREHFLSLAYHALYHKGSDSGIPASETAAARSARAGHDYISILRRLAAGLGVDVAITLEDLDAYLDAQGWRPPHDMLIRLSRRNRWMRSLLRQHESSGTFDDRLAVFLVRQEALRRGGVDSAAKLIVEQGFEVRAIRKFDEKRIPTLARSLRGGNWGSGPWPISGGPPVAAIVAYDPAPITPTRKQKKRFPFITNARLLCKERLRDAFNDGIPSDRHCNVIHSSDNGREALDYLRIIMPECVDQLLTGAPSQPVSRAA